MPRLKRLSFWQRLDRYPPILLRLLTVYTARGSKWVPSDREIAETGQLTIAEVKRLSWETDWSNIPLGTIRRYLAGCRVNLEDRRTFRRLEWMRRSGVFRHIRQSPLWKTQLQEIAEAYVQHCEQGDSQ